MINELIDGVEGDRFAVPQTSSRILDDEIEALDCICTALDALEGPERSRVLTYIDNRYGDPDA